MEIKVGEYVRTNNGIIGKYVKYRGWQDTIETNNKWIGFDIDKDIVKHSKDIIDLVQKGDYINGDKVVDRDNNSILTLTDSGQTCYRSIFESKDIKTVITKEQIKQIEYRIKE